MPANFARSGGGDDGVAAHQLPVSRGLALLALGALLLLLVLRHLFGSVRVEAGTR